MTSVVIIMLVIDRGGSSQDLKVWESDYWLCFCLVFLAEYG